MGVTGRTSTLSFRVRWGETDAAGIVFFATFFDWFDNATHELLRPSGALASFTGGDGLIHPIVESRARFRSPAFFDDELVVTSRVTHVGRRSYRVDHVVARGEEILATGHEVRVTCRREPGDRRLRAVDIPPALRAFLAGEGAAT